MALSCDCASPDCYECNDLTIRLMGPKRATQYGILWRHIDKSGLAETEESPDLARARTQSIRQHRAKQLSRRAQRWVLRGGW